MKSEKPALRCVYKVNAKLVSGVKHLEHSINALPNSKILSRGTSIECELGMDKGERLMLLLSRDSIQFTFFVDVESLHDEASRLIKTLAVLEYLSKAYSVEINSIYPDIIRALRAIDSDYKAERANDPKYESVIDQLSQQNSFLARKTLKLLHEKAESERALLKYATIFIKLGASYGFWSDAKIGEVAEKTALDAKLLNWAIEFSNSEVAENAKTT